MPTEHTPTIRVSAIVSSYCAERFMRGRLENLVQQTLFRSGELEIIVVDSASPENERAIVEEFQQRYPRIHYLRTAERETVYRAWNRGIRLASGRFVTNQNTDDRMRLDALEHLADYLDAHPDVALVHADQVQVPTGEEVDLDAYTGEGHFRWHPFSRLGLIISTQAGSQPMWRRSLHDRFGMFDDSFVILGDQEFFLRASAGGDYHFIPEVLGTLNYRPDSVSRNVSVGNQEWLRIFQTYTSRDRLASLLQCEVDHPINDDQYQALLNNFVCLLALETIQKPGLPFPKVPLDLLINAVSLGRHQEVLTRNLLRIVSQLLTPEEAQKIVTPEARSRFGSLLETIQAHSGLELLPIRTLPTGLPEPIKPRRPVTQSRPPASLVVVTYNSAQTIEQCVEATLRTMGPDDEIILVDNASQDTTPRLLAELAQRDRRVRYFLSSENLGFSAGSNLGLQRARGEHLVLLNPDTMPFPGWLEEMAHQAQLEGVGAVGPTSDYVAGWQKWPLHAPDLSPATPLDRIAHRLGSANHQQGVDTKLLIGFCLLIPRPVLDHVGLLDEELFLGNDDLDLSWRLQLAGCRLRVATGAFVHHIGQVSFNTEPGERTRRLVQQSTDALARKMVRYYGPGQVPSAMELWEMSWFAPTPGILEGASPEAPSAAGTSLPEPKGFNIVLAPVDAASVKQATKAYLEAFSEQDDVGLFILAGPQLQSLQAAALEALAELGRNPDRIPDMSLLDQPSTPGDLPDLLRSADLVLGSDGAIEAARLLGKPAVREATPEFLKAAVRYFASLDWTAPDIKLESDAQERWLVAANGSWQQALEAYLIAVPPEQGVALVIQAEAGKEQTLQEQVATWLDQHGHDPEGIPDVLIVSAPGKAEVALFRAATAWIERDGDRERALAMALGKRLLAPNAEAMRVTLEIGGHAHMHRTEH